MLEVLLTFAFVTVILLVTGKAAVAGLRRAGHRPEPDRGAPDRDPAHRDVGEPGPLARPGAVRRRGAAGPRVAVHRRAARRRCARLPRRPVHLRSARPDRGRCRGRRRDRGPGADRRGPSAAGADAGRDGEPRAAAQPAPDRVTRPGRWVCRRAGGAVWGRVALPARRAATDAAATEAASTTSRPCRCAAPGATITPYRDGPLIVRGDFRLVDQDGTEIDPGRRDDRALPVREVRHQALLRRHPQAVGLLGAERAQPAPSGRTDPARGPPPRTDLSRRPDG